MAESATQWVVAKALRERPGVTAVLSQHASLPAAIKALLEAGPGHVAFRTVGGGHRAVVTYRSARSAVSGGGTCA